MDIFYDSFTKSIKIFLFLYAHVKVNENVFFLFFKTFHIPFVCNEHSYRSNILFGWINKPLMSFNLKKLALLRRRPFAQIVIRFFFQSQLKLLLVTPWLPRRPAFLLCWNVMKKTSTFSSRDSHSIVRSTFAATVRTWQKTHTLLGTIPSWAEYRPGHFQ